jgi:hypothetical protein
VKTIEITVDPQGQAKVETKGFSGPECREASRSLELALGRSTGETLTAESYTPATEVERLRQSS